MNTNTIEQTKIVHLSDIKWEEYPVFSGLIYSYFVL